MIDATQTYSNGSVSPQKQTNKQNDSCLILLSFGVFVVYFTMNFQLEWHSVSPHEKYWRDHWPTMEKAAQKLIKNQERKKNSSSSIVVSILIIFYSLLYLVFFFFAEWVQTEQYHFPDFIRGGDILFAIWFLFIFRSLAFFLAVLSNIKPKFMECQLLK